MMAEWVRLIIRPADNGYIANLHYPDSDEGYSDRDERAVFTNRSNLVDFIGRVLGVELCILTTPDRVQEAE